ncbi:hypothetical protein KC669_01240 [Candidatus Dojkabacteria bacterium]|uniref:Uncharacterized protein n=1 Tax=Candidatus Dojkabacteria bacterium TaxID=2099670 RepID=A0A955RLS3_9BACT|nr:hypothetical protein [Candidatus Dojkabacteria bacterium]
METNAQNYTENPVYITISEQSSNISARRECILRYIESQYFDLDNLEIAIRVHLNSQVSKGVLSTSQLVEFIEYIYLGKPNSYISINLNINGDQIKQLTKTVTNVLQISMLSSELETIGIQPRKDKSTLYKRVHVFSAKELKVSIGLNPDIPDHYLNFLTLISNGIYPTTFAQTILDEVPDNIITGTNNFIHRWRDQIVKGELLTTGEQLAFIIESLRHLNDPSSIVLTQTQIKLYVANGTIDNYKQRVRMFASLSKYIHNYDMVLSEIFFRTQYSITPIFDESTVYTPDLFDKKFPYTIGLFLEYYIQGYDMNILINLLALTSGLSSATVSEQFDSIRRVMQNIYSYKWFVRKGYRQLDFIEVSVRDDIKQFLVNFIEQTRAKLTELGEL